MPKSNCQIEGCDRVHLARGWCATHYARWRKHGDPTIVLPHHRARARGTAAEEFRLIRDTKLRQNYGITLDDYNAMVAAQGGRCKLCRVVPKRLRLRKDGLPWTGLVVDHDHETGAVRGLLCHGCNVAMGRVDKVGLATITDYLTG